MGSISIMQTVLSLLAGLGLFLLGMQNMSEGLQKSAGDRLKKILGKLTSNRIVGVGVGMFITAVIQSSSATTVMVVGFVNAGLISLTQALSVILGANVGTTITGQIIAFKVTTLSLPFIALGALIFIFCKKKYPYLSYFGQLVLGLGLIFYGMNMMTDAFKPLATLPEFKNLFVYFSDNMLLAVLAGAVLTMILQSSSATMGITMALATTGVLPFPAAAALILGENIGTTITANLAALGASRMARQAAFGHFLFNLVGVIYMLILIQPIIHFINIITPGDYAYFDTESSIYPYVARHLANYHTMFNIINTLIFLPLLPLLAKACEKVIKPSKEDEAKVMVPNLAKIEIPTPDFAVKLAQGEMEKAFKLVVNIYEQARIALPTPNATKVLPADALNIETRDKLDTLHQYVDEIKSVLSRLSISSSTARGTRITAQTMFNQLEDIETLGERARKLIKTSVKFYDQDEKFSEDAKKELENVLKLVDENFYGFENIFHGKGIISEVSILAERSDEVNKLKKEYKKNHLQRLTNEACSFRAGILFNNLLDTLEKIADSSYKMSKLYFK